MLNRAPTSGERPTLKPHSGRADVLAALAWAAEALTSLGWYYSVLNMAYSNLGDVTDVSMMTTGMVLFITAPAAAAVLAVYAARVGHRSGKIAVIVSGLLLPPRLSSCRWTAVDRPGRRRGGLGAGSRLAALPQDRRGGIRAAAPSDTCFRRVAQRRVDPCSRDRRASGGRGAGFRLGAPS
jgi:hypothetical protein